MPVVVLGVDPHPVMAMAAQLSTRPASQRRREEIDDKA
jgi:hypothetical protein